MATLDVILQLQNAAFRTGLEQARSQVKEFRGELSGMFAGAISFGGVTAAIGEAVEYAGRVADLAARFGESAESIQRVDFAAGQAGTDIEGVATAMGRVTRAAVEAATKGGDLEAAFAALGIRAADFVNLSMDEKLVALSQGLQAVQGDGERLALAMQLLGKSGAEMLPLLLQGPDALRDALGQATVMADGTVARLDALGDRFGAMWQSIRATVGSVIIGIADEWQAFVVKATVGVDTIRRAYSSLFTGAREMFTGDFASARKTFESIGQTIRDAGKVANETIMDLRREGVSEPNRARRGGMVIPEEAEEIGGRKAQAAEFGPGSNAGIAEFMRQMEAQRKRDEVERDRATNRAEQFRERAERSREKRLGDIFERLDKAPEKQKLELSPDAIRQIGGSLGGVNYQALINAEATKQTALQQRMAESLAKIEAKDLTIEIAQAR